MEKILYKTRLNKLGLKGQVYFLNLRGSIYFLENAKDKSLNLLRKNTDYSTKKPKEFFNEIHKDYLIKKTATEKANKTKQEYYKLNRIKTKERKIKRLKEEILNAKKDLRIIKKQAIPKGL